MNVSDDFGERVSAIAESTPRNAIENLLLGLMPRVPVTARKVAVDNGGRPVDPPVTLQPDGTVQPGPFRKLVRGPRTRQPRGRAYTILDSNATRHHRPGTWTFAMVRCATTPDEANTLTATTKLRDEYPIFADRNIDWNWLAKVGYISF